MERFAGAAWTAGRRGYRQIVTRLAVALLVVLSLAGAAIAQSSADLTNLTFNPPMSAMTPAFSSDVTSYRVDMENRHIRVEVRPFRADPNAKVFVNGTLLTVVYVAVELEVGPNEVIIEVVSADDTARRIYKVNLVRSAEPNRLADGVVGVFQQVRLTTSGLAAGGTPRVVAGAPPPGLTVRMVGGRLLLDGTPERKGHYAFTLASADPTNHHRIDYAITVRGDPEQAESIVDSTHALVERFVRSRQGLLLSSADVPGLRERQAGAQPFAVVLSPGGDDLRLSFAGSTASVDMLNRLAAGEGDRAPAFKVWARGQAAMQTVGGDDAWRTFGAVSLGADYLLSEHLLAGLALHLDTITDPAGPGIALGGDGWLAGPYVSLQLGDGIFWDTSLFYGGSQNTIENESWSGAFATRRWQFDTTLSGQWALDEHTTVAPRINVAYASETVEGFALEDVVDDVLSIAGFDVAQLRASLGADLSRRIELENGVVLTPRLGITAGVSDLAGSQMFGVLTAGAALRGPSAWTVDGAVTLGAESSGTSSIGASARIGGRF